MQLFAKTMNGTMYKIEVHKSGSIQNMKEKIMEKIRSNVNEQRLVYKGEILDDEKNVKDYQIRDESIINVIVKLRNGMRLFAKMMDGKIVTFEVLKSDSIRNIKEKIRESINLGVNQQRLVYRGEMLNDEKTIKYYQIEDGSIINVVVTLKDGMKLLAKTLDEKIVAFEVLKSDSIQNMKEKIREKAGLSVDEQKLVYEGVILENNKTVEDYQIRDGSVIIIVARFRMVICPVGKIKKEEWDIFLSNHPADSGVVEEISNYLTSHHYKICTNSNIESTGETEINYITNSKLFLAALSASYEKSNNCMKQFRFSISKHKVLLLVQVEKNCASSDFISYHTFDKLYVKYDVENKERSNNDLSNKIKIALTQ